MDIKQIKQVIELMKRAELNEFSVEEEGFKLKIRRGSGKSNGGGRNSMPPFYVATDPAQATMAPIPASPVAAPSASDSAAAAASSEEVGVTYIKAPMVGTFYLSPSPEAQPFADVGTQVTETSVVCILEAMKIMNEIQAEVKGTIVEVLVEDGDPIEYGQKLFKVKSS